MRLPRGLVSADRWLVSPLKCRPSVWLLRRGPLTAVTSVFATSWEEEKKRRRRKAAGRRSRLATRRAVYRKSRVNGSSQKKEPPDCHVTRLNSSRKYLAANLNVKLFVENGSSKDTELRFCCCIYLQYPYKKARTCDGSVYDNNNSEFIIYVMFFLLFLHCISTFFEKVPHQARLHRLYYLHYFNIESGLGRDAKIIIFTICVAICNVDENMSPNLLVIQCVENTVISFAYYPTLLIIVRTLIVQLFWIHNLRRPLVVRACNYIRL